MPAHMVFSKPSERSRRAAIATKVPSKERPSETQFSDQPKPRRCRGSRDEPAPANNRAVAVDGSCRTVGGG